VFRHNEQIDDCKRFEVVVHEKQVWIVARSQTLAFRLEGTIDNPCPEFALLALEFEFLVARRAEEIRKRAIIGE
jgi:hypothetical protein